MIGIYAVAAAVLAIAAPSAFAGAGDPDPSFGVNGRIVADVDPFSEAFATSMAIDSQGRILVAGYLGRSGLFPPIVARFNPDGSLDPSFGAGGVMRPKWNPGPITGIAIDRAGRIVLGGSIRNGPIPDSPLPGKEMYLDSDFAVARLLGNGEPDLSFAAGGLLKFGSGGDDYGFDLALDSQGRILIAGQSASRFAAARVSDSGVLDSSFGSYELGGLGVAEAIATDPQGRVVVAGTLLIAGRSEFAVTRVGDSGKLDPSLDGDGVATLDFGPQLPFGIATDLVIDASGRLLLVGKAGYRPAETALVGRLLPDGSPDPSFDGDGKFTLDLPGSVAAEGVAIDRNGQIMVVGTRSESEVNVTAEEAFLARLGPEGPLDPSFGAGGVVRERFLTDRFARGAAVVTDSAGRYLIAGGAWGSEANGLALARYLSGDQPPAELRRCRGRQATIIGTSRADRLRGTRRRDVIVGLGGNDRIRAFGGKDLICAGSGRDLVRAGAGNDMVFGGPGNDMVFGQTGKDRLRGGPGRDVER
ncbi:MAG TPA: hypothetical protein VMS60_11335 [Solirubrobacterales bacterium]|nr:hypothetical protein [Solirubrobacterales bacterium]